MDLLSTYLMMNMLSGLSSTNSTGSLLNSGQTSGTTGTLSFLDILQGVQNQSSRGSVSSTDSTSSSSTLSAGSTMDAIFERAAQKYGVSASLLKAIGKAESNFNASVVSSAGAIGVMQLMPGTARSLGVTNPYDAEQNIMGGAKYISQMLDRYDGDVKLALAAYNAGPGNVDKYGGVPPFTETQNYVNRVLEYMGDNVSAGNTTVQTQTASESSSDSDTIEIKKETLLTLVTLMRAQMELQMASGLSSWNTGSDSSSLFSL